MIDSDSIQSPISMTEINIESAAEHMQTELRLRSLKPFDEDIIITSTQHEHGEQKEKETGSEFHIRILKTSPAWAGDD